MNIPEREWCPVPSKLLKALGRDCAGDVSMLEEDAVPYSHATRYTPFDKDISLIATQPFETITQLQEETRLSLAGGQKKIALYHPGNAPFNDNWFIPEQGAPSTHILKPGILDHRYPHLTLNEFLCMHAAAICGIETAQTEILFPKTPLLIVRRFDRTRSGENTDEGLPIVERIHQEDCCQACGPVKILESFLITFDCARRSYKNSE